MVWVKAQRVVRCAGVRAMGLRARAIDREGMNAFDD